MGNQLSMFQGCTTKKKSAEKANNQPTAQGKNIFF